MKRKFFIVFIIVLVTTTLFVSVFSAGRTFRIKWFFFPESTWTGWHPGLVTFDIWAANTGHVATIDEAWYLSWFFWLWNVWWGTFSHWVATCRPQIVCPTDILRNPNQYCVIHGCGWSQNSWWMIMSGTSIGGTYTGVYYNPQSALIEGFAWSRGLGWVPFYADMWSPVTPTTQTWISADGLGINFIWQIAIIGNIAGTRIYESAYQTVANIFSTTKHAEIMNSVHKNVTLLSRNIDDILLEDESSAFDFLVEKNDDFIFDFNRSWPANKRTIVTIGQDIVLDQEDINPNPESFPTRALISLKDYNGSWWNIVVTDKVKRIYAFIYAEWSLFSGEKSATWAIVPYVNSGSWNIPTNQLYIKGMLISKNTVWWAQQSPSVCPVVINDCTPSIAEIYDLDFFRTYDSNDPLQRSVPSSITDTRLNRSSMIIQYDQSILADSPPGLDHVFQ